LILAPLFLIKKKLGLYIISIVVLLGITSLFHKVVFPYIFNLLNSEDINNGPMSLLAITFIIIGSVILLYRENSLIEKKEKEFQTEKTSLELKFLKSQLNPHFLFNSLNSIYALSTKKSDNTPESIIMLSELMRYMIYEAKEDLIPISNELNYIKNYFDLQYLRIANTDAVTLNIHGDIASQKISPLLLISFIENAFKYGTDSDGKTTVRIDIEVKGDELNFKCINTVGNQLKKNDRYSGIGIKNTKNRLALLYPNKHYLITEEKDHTFNVKLNLKLE